MARLIDRLVYRIVGYTAPLAVGALLSNLGILGGVA